MSKHTVVRKNEKWVEINYQNHELNAHSRVFVDGEDLVRGLLVAIGEDPDRPGLKETPSRVVRSWQELFSGYGIEPRDVLGKIFLDCGAADEMVLVKDIPFVSHCEHHLAQFSGVVHVAYLPKDGAVLGLSKLARLVEVFARRLQVQERMTTQIADALMDTSYSPCLDPKGVGVVVQASHSCMSCRGVRKPGTTTITSALRGAFKDDPATRSEFLSLTRK